MTRDARCGIVVMAYGSREYHRQAEHLAMSLRRHSPHVPLTVVTDRPTVSLKKFYDAVVPYVGDARTDCRPKLDLDQYTPYDRTLYVDADALAVRDVQFLLDRFADEEFVVLGRNIDSGHWYTDVPRLCRLSGTPTVPKFSGGFMYFRNTTRTHKVFSDARTLADQYDTLQLDNFNGGIADEPLLSIALARHGFTASPSAPDAAVSLLGTTSPLHLNISKSITAFDKNHRPMRPAIVHFAADFSSKHHMTGAHYRRETLRLRLSENTRLSDPAAGFIAHIRYGVTCALVNTFIRAARRAPGEPRTVRPSPGGADAPT